MRKKAFITGITGQDGSYMAELLLEDNYEVHGVVRRSSLEKLDRLEEAGIVNDLILHEGDMGDPISTLTNSSSPCQNVVLSLSLIMLVIFFRLIYLRNSPTHTSIPFIGSQ